MIFVTQTSVIAERKKRELLRKSLTKLQEEMKQQVHVNLSSASI